MPYSKSIKRNILSHIFIQVCVYLHNTLLNSCNTRSEKLKHIQSRQIADNDNLDQRLPEAT